MTFRMDGTDVMEAIEIASVVGSIVAMLVIALIVYLMVRPTRRQRQAPPEDDAFDAEEMLRLMERMEQRLEVLERVVTDRTRNEDRLLEAGAERPEMRRKK